MSIREPLQELAGAPEPEPVTLSLTRKLADVMAAVGRVPKRGRNAFHGYDYVMEADIVEALRGELAARHVLLLPSLVSHERIETAKATKSGGNYYLSLLTLRFTFLDGDSDETVSGIWMGSGWDAEDKGLYKAMTGAEKYFLMKMFLLPTGDDPEVDTEEPTVPLVPDGLFDEWLIDMTSTAAQGEAALRAAWTGSKIAYREYLSKHRAQVWADLKARAAKVKQS